jgi:DNA-binding CsgD family transcriptional regulator/PAS domain-containing protein
LKPDKLRLNLKARELDVSEVGKLNRAQQRQEQESTKCKQPEKSLRLTNIERSILDSLSAHIAILDENGVILETNRAWKLFATANQIRIHPDTVNVNYLRVCDMAMGESADESKTVAEGIRAVIDGKTEEFVIDYPCHSPYEKRWFYMRVTRISGSEPRRVVVSHENITALKLAEEALRKREQELELKTKNLAETNTALKVLLKQREGDRLELEQRVLSNIRELVLPYIDKIKRAKLEPREKGIAEIIESHLNDLVSPFLQRLSTVKSVLTPQEIQVAALVKEGRTSKEIGEILGVSDTTINFHRKNLRRKLGLSNTQTNLRTHLLSLS